MQHRPISKLLPTQSASRAAKQLSRSHHFQRPPPLSRNCPKVPKDAPGQTQYHSPNEIATPDFSSGNDERFSPAPEKHFDSSPPTPAALPSKSNSSCRRQSRHETPSCPKASRRE